MSLVDLKKAVTLIHRSGRTAVFLSKSAEYLYPLYIWMFRTFYSSGGGHERSLVLDKKLQLLLDSTFGELFLRHRQIDPFVTSILKKAELNYVESVRIYHLLNGQVPRSLPPPVDIFCTAEHAQRLLANLPGDPAFFVVGRRDPKIEHLLGGPLAGKDVRTLEGADFTFHSRPEDVARIVATAAGNGIRPVVFHNYPDNRPERITLSGAGSYLPLDKLSNALGLVRVIVKDHGPNAVPGSGGYDPGDILRGGVEGEICSLKCPNVFARQGAAD